MSMSFEFLKEEYLESLEDLNKLKSDFLYNPINFELLNYNNYICKDISNFFKSKEKCFILSGFIGSGKSLILEHLKKYIKPDVIVFKYNFPEKFHLDDILLSFFDDIKYFSKKGLIKLQKNEIKSFVEKFNYYFRSIKYPIVIILDSCENAALDEKNFEKTLDFFVHLLSEKNQNIKIIFSTRNFNSINLKNYGLNYHSSIIKPFDIDYFNHYFRNKKLSIFSLQKYDVFNITRGHYFYFSKLFSLSKTLNKDFFKLIEEFKNQKDFLLDFITSEYIKLLSLDELKFLYLVASIRYNFTKKIYIKLQFANSDLIEKLLKYEILNEDNNNIYLKSYFKLKLLNKIEAQNKKEISDILIKFYSNQLELKPAERDIKISRATARSEIEYHKILLKECNELIEKNTSSIVPNDNSALNTKKNIDMAYWTYSKTVLSSWNKENKGSISDISIEDKIKKQIKKDKPETIIYVNSIDNSNDVKPLDENALTLDDIVLTEEEKELLKSKEINIRSEKNSITEEADREENKNILSKNNIEKLLKFKEEFIDSKDKIDKNNQDNGKEITEKNLSYENYLDIAYKFEKKYEYQDSLSVYNLIIKNNLADNYIKKSFVFAKIGKVYEILNDFERALYHLNLAYEIYLKNNDIKKSLYILIEIGKIYKNTYRIKEAKKIYIKILKTRNIPQNLTLRVVLDYYDIESDLNINKSLFEEVNKSLDIESLSENNLVKEFYFKYGLLLDDLEKYDLALQMYLKSIEYKEKDNKLFEFLSAAYSNIGQLYKIKRDEENAIKYFKLALKNDLEDKNYDGAYLSFSELAKLYRKIDIKIALSYYQRASEVANKMGNIFYLIQTFIEIGDIYYFKKNDSNAIEMYLKAKKLIKKEAGNNEIIENIDIRLNDLKVRLGNVEYNRLVNNFGS